MRGRQFKATDGTDHTIRVDIVLADWVLENTEVDLLDAEHADKLLGLLGDPRLAARVLFFASRRPTNSPDIGQELASFCETLDGDTIEAGVRALWQAVLDFCPSHRKEVLAAAVARQLEINEAAAREAERLLANPVTAAKIEEAIRRAGAELEERMLAGLSAVGSGPSPESSASIPPAGPSESSNGQSPDESSTIGASRDY